MRTPQEYRGPLLAGAAILAALAVWIVLSRGDGEPSIEPIKRDDATSARPADLQQDRLSEVAAVAPGRQRREAVPTPAGEHVLRVRTLRGGRRIYPGAEVLLRVYNGYEAQADPATEIRLTSDAQGELVYNLGRLDGAVFVWLKGDMANHWCFTKTLRLVPPTRRWTSLDLTLYPLDAWIVGTVTGASGRPIPRTKIMTWYSKAEADGLGQYRIPAPAGASSTMLYAFAPGYAQTRKDARGLRKGIETRVDFELESGMVVTGKVRDATGAPVAGVTVTSSRTWRNESISAADGSYRLDGVPSKGDWMVIYGRKPTYLEAKATIDEARGDVTRDLVMKRGVAVRGVVVDPAGAPVRGAELYIGFSPSAYNRLDAVAGDDGRFEFLCVAPGEQTLVTQHGQFAADTRKIQVPAGVGTYELTLQLQRGHFIAGRLQDERGVGLVDVGLSVRHQGEYLDSMRTTTGAGGAFRLVGLPGEAVSLEFYGRGFMRTTHPVRELDRDDLVVTMQYGGAVSGRVVDANTSEPIRRFRVRFVAPKLEPGDSQAYIYGPVWSGSGKAFDDAGGEWETGAILRTGRVLGLEIRADGYFSTMIPRVVVPKKGDADGLVIRMHRGGILNGILLTERSEQPVAHASIQLITDTMRLGGHLRPADGARISARSGTDGRFRLSNLPATKGYLLVRHDDFPEQLEGPIDFKVTEGVVRIVHVAPGARVEGTVADSGGRALPNSTVVMWQAKMLQDPIVRSHYVNLKTISDARGNFGFDRVPPGRYVLGHYLDEKLREVAFARYVTVPSRGKLSVRLVPEGQASISGTIVSAGPVPSRMIVRLSRREARKPSTPRTWTSRTALAHEGVFAVRGLRAGTWYVSAAYMDTSANKQWRGVTEVKVGDGPENTVIVRLR